MNRRSFALLTLAGLLAACGESTSPDTSNATSPDTEPATTDDLTTPTSGGSALGASALAVSERESGGDPAIAARSITDFGYRLFAAVAAGNDPSDDVTISPASIAIALALLEPGAVGTGSEQLRSLLMIDDGRAFHDSMNGLEQTLESRRPQVGGDGEPGDVVIRVGNAAYLQPGVPFIADYLDTIGRNYGAVLNELDFAADPDGAVEVINVFVADATEGKITDVLQRGNITVDTVLALVNTLYLKASWLSPFGESRTEVRPFTLADGSEIDVDMMSGSGDVSAAGDGWVGATKAHVGGLSSQFVRPDDGRFDEVAGRLSDVFDELSTSERPGGELRMPRFETRVDSSLEEPLMSLGLTDVFRPGALLGIVDDPRLLVSKVAHSTFVAYDEDGVEAAAATVILAEMTSGPIEEPVPVVLDRPFFYRIFDQRTGATLFLGRVMEPQPI